MRLKELIAPTETEMECKEVREIYDLLSWHSTYSTLYYCMGLAWGTGNIKEKKYLDRIYDKVFSYQLANTSDKSCLLIK